MESLARATLCLLGESTDSLFILSVCFLLYFTLFEYLDTAVLPASFSVPPRRSYF